MKTEQEQIDEMVKVIKGFDICGLFERCFSTGADGENTRYITCPECFAEALYNAGYGDVSEYKAEIERLNSHNGFLQSVISHSKDMLDEAVKQAQIDVLNQLKERAIGYTFLGEKLATETDIDELIEEVQNGEDKSRTRNTN